jgi:hypothetical protein
MESEGIYPFSVSMDGPLLDRLVLPCGRANPSMLSDLLIRLHNDVQPGRQVLESISHN